MAAALVPDALRSLIRPLPPAASRNRKVVDHVFTSVSLSSDHSRRLDLQNLRQPLGDFQPHLLLGRLEALD